MGRLHRPLGWQAIRHHQIAAWALLALKSFITNTCTWESSYDGADPMNCVFKSCGGFDSQHRIIRDCSHEGMLACRDKYVALLKRRSRDITARRYQAAPYFNVYLDVAFRPGGTRALTSAWTGILDPRLVETLEVVRPAWPPEGGTTTTAYLKECRGPADCVRENLRIRHRLMQAMRGYGLVRNFYPQAMPEISRRYVLGEPFLPTYIKADLTPDDPQPLALFAMTRKLWFALILTKMRVV